MSGAHLDPAVTVAHAASGTFLLYARFLADGTEPSATEPAQASAS